MLKDFFIELVKNAVAKAIANNELGQMTPSCAYELVVEVPKNLEFGDFAINVSSLARFARLGPPQIAQAIAKNIDDENIEINTIQGFINFKVSNRQLSDVISEVLEQNSLYGKNNFGDNEKVILEYVSANPTGPFHIGHGRWAGMGSALANLMKFCGYDIFQEFYINDAGVQIKNLTNSLFIRVSQEQGLDVDFPEDEVLSKSFYKGEYLIPIAKSFIEEHGEFAKSLPKKADEISKEQFKVLSKYAKSKILDYQKELLEKFKVYFDSFYSELELHSSNKVEDCIKKLDESGMLYEKDGALWFKSTKYGDDQDRVIKKSDGYYTYLTADIAYHYDKMERGFTKMINIWGADHHGYVPRMRASIEALGKDPDMLEVLLGQLVNLVIKGEQVRMGKRTKMLTLDELINEVGVDATRFWMILRSIDTTLDFDVDLAKSKTDENPIFYVQYAHARACSILRNATEQRPDALNGEILPPAFTKDEIESSSKFINELWNTEDEKAFESTKRLVLKLEDCKSVLINACKNRAPYLLCTYVIDLAQAFHHFYTYSRVLTDNKALSLGRLALVKSTKTIIKNVLDLLAVSAPEKM